MFFKQIRRSAAKNRKGNGLFFGSLVAAIVAFYTLLSLGEQDVMCFLATVESDAVSKLLDMLFIVYGVSLFFVFFLVYFACRYQTDSRRRELGLYLMMGMRQSRMFAMLFAETLWSSLISLLIGLPAALFLTEGISLATAKIAGLGIIGHHISFSLDAILWTVCGFVLVQLLSMLIICVGLGRTEPADFFRTGDTEKQEVLSGAKSMVFFCLGLALLLAAYYLGVVKMRMLDLMVLLAVVVFGICGTFFLYRGLGGFLGLRIRRKNPDAAGLQTFTARQVQENVLSQHKSLAVSSLLLMMALACVSYGISMGLGNSTNDRSVDFSFFGEKEEIEARLNECGVRDQIQEVYPMYLSLVKDGYFSDQERAFDLTELENAMAAAGGTEDAIHSMRMEYIIAQSSYNQILKGLGKEPLDLSDGEAAVYSALMRYTDAGPILQKALESGISVGIDGTKYKIRPAFYYDNIVADRAITLYLALIVPDALYRQLARESGVYCYNARLRDDAVREKGLMQAVQGADALLYSSGIRYESYLAGIGRNLFYMVAAGYLTIYLGVLFWLIANTVIGLKYLIGQRKTKHRYETLAMLGADTDAMCRSVRKQIGVYFALALVTAISSGAAAIVTMFTSFAKLPAGVSVEKTALISGAAFLSFVILEAAYIRVVKRAASREIGQLEIKDQR